MQLRDYQSECIDLIDSLDGGDHLVQMATGLGKTVTFANIPRKKVECPTPPLHFATG